MLLLLLLLLCRSLNWPQNQLTMHIILDEIFSVCVVCVCAFFGAQERNSSFCFIFFSFSIWSQCTWALFARSFIYLPTVCIIHMMYAYLYSPRSQSQNALRHTAAYSSLSGAGARMRDSVQSERKRKKTIDGQRKWERARQRGCVICIR